MERAVREMKEAIERGVTLARLGIDPDSDPLPGEEPRS
jgi:hypothetical protein